MARKNALVAITRDENGTLTFTVGNAGSFTLTPATLTDEIRNHAMAHGLVQKVSDAAAMPKDELAGKSDDEIASLKFNAMQSVAERIANGEWSKRSGDGSGPVAGIIYRAFERWVGEIAKKAKKDAPSTDAIRAKYDAMSRGEQLALRNVPAIGKIMDELRADKGSKSEVDTSALLADIGL
jgi:hypothetical protein